MECRKCNALIPQGEEREHNKEILCEDCYIDVLSPAAFCDPWATYNAESFNKRNPETAFTDSQLKILNTLKESGGLDPDGLADRLTDHMSRQDGERECAALHRMGKISIESKNGSVFICVKH
ncbi:hypothetical protein [Desulfoluna spongiiphila]|uniref:hypothetical protein n=1 Tax=Desulfoluna spongiiphila TaxID=419481 RepID=UPI0012580DFC|nr:hypothetical protein [Desulfoluna spongiiphila]VVS95608.1 hypothetical protein DBB_51850 [Desulfoluna spongiiphila]